MTQAVFSRIKEQRLTNKEVMAIDMHFHTQYSLDGMSKIKDSVKKAAKLGIGIAITDHNQIKGSMLASKNRLDVPIIPGIETTTLEGVHTLYYFYDHSELNEFYNHELKHHMTHNPFFAHITTEELMLNSKDYNCIVAAPHPFAPGMTGIQRIKITKEMKKQIKLIETLNGYNLRRLNKKAIMWANESQRPMTAGSDGHTTTELGNSITMARSSSIEEFFSEMLKSNNVIAGKEENLFLKAVLALKKEKRYIKNVHKKKSTKLLLRSQFGTEYNHLIEEFKNIENSIHSWVKINHW
jgi:predicted metal-dependent phosphoesterase TrpH